MASKQARTRIWLRIVAAILGLLLAAIAKIALGQDPSQSTSTDGAMASIPPSSIEDALQQMSSAAGVIFTGQVTAIRRISGQGGASGLVEVDFLVTNAVRGCISGQTYTLREWAGLWSDNSGRYRVGQRLLMMLRTPNTSGISSPVAGMDGAIPIRGVESAISPNSATPATMTGATVSATIATPGSFSPATAPSAPVDMVDLRWIGARTLRIQASSEGTVSGTIVGGTTTGGNVSSVPAQGASVDTVLGMLSTWVQGRAAK
jgi:hypothetical protein